VGPKQRAAAIKVIDRNSFLPLCRDPARAMPGNQGGEPARLDRAFSQRYKATMGWVGGILGLALVAIVVAIGTDVYMTKCQSGSFYAIVGLCSPPTAGQKPAAPADP
jgi:hypothetical protein